MGLDMYLGRYPRIENVTPRQVYAVESIPEWKEEGDGCSLAEWCGIDETELPDAETIAKLESYRHISYAAWDTDHSFPHNDIHDMVGYWRKANAIHKWFVDHVQGGEDDCQFHREVEREDLEELRDTCKKILETAVLGKGKVENGYSFKNGKMQPVYEEGLVILNPEVCEELLPVTSGFFFGGMQYNEWYLKDIQYTFELCEKLLRETDFEKTMFYYVSSW